MFWYGGVRLKVIAYNALLQGQFRESAVDYAAADLKPVVAQAWLGYRHYWTRHSTVGVEFRVQTAELDMPQGGRPALWGSVTFDWRD